MDHTIQAVVAWVSPHMHAFMLLGLTDFSGIGTTGGAPGAGAPLYRNRGTHTAHTVA